MEQDIKDIQAVSINMPENIVAIEGLDTLLEMLIQKYERLKSQYDFVLCPQ